MELSEDTSVPGDRSRLAALLEAEGLIDRLHEEAENHRARLSRRIHDDLGGMMVAAAMDFTAVRQRLPGLDVTVLDQLDRVQKCLEAAIDMSRRMVEELRPSILDNFGLFAALKWQLRQASGSSNAVLTHSFPISEPSFKPVALTALFRIAQEAIGMIFKRSDVRSADINLQIDDHTITMQFTDNGSPIMANGVELDADTALASMRHRIRAHGGSVELRRADKGGTVLIAQMPLPREPNA